MLSLISILSKIRIICHSQCLRTLISIVTKSPTPKSLPMFSAADFRVIKCAKPCHWLCFRTHFRVISSTKILLMSLFSNTDFHANKSVKLLSMSILLKTFSCKTHVTANTYEHWFSCCQKRESCHRKCFRTLIFVFEHWFPRYQKYECHVAASAFEHWFSCCHQKCEIYDTDNAFEHIFALSKVRNSCKCQCFRTLIFMIIKTRNPY